jgi:hypothetical protein
VGPSGLIAGLVADAEQAEKDQLPPDRLTTLLAEYRAGDAATAAAAAKRLSHVLRYVAYRFFHEIRWSHRRAAEEVLGTLFSELGTVIKRLHSNQVTAAELEGHVCGYLEHSTTHYMVECSQRIPAKASTNSERKKRGLEPWQGLSRVSDSANGQSNYGDDEGDEHVSHSKLEDPPPCDVVTPSGDAYRSPYFHDEREPDLLSDLQAVTNNESEEEFVWLLGQGHTLGEVADLLGISRRQADKIKKRLIARLSRQ